MAFREMTGVAKVSSLLTAGFESGPIAIACNQFKTITFHLAYTRGGAAGGFSYKIEWSIDKVNWAQMPEIQDPAIVAGTDVVDLTQRAELKYIATGATQEILTSPTLAVSGIFVRVSMKEVGNLVTPGTGSATFYAQGDS